MFSILDRYIGKHILVGTAIALMLVVGLDAVFTVIDQMRDVGTGSYTLSTVLYFVGLSMPWKMAQAVPMATLIGSIMSLGVMASHSELIVMRAAGLSISRIVLGVLKTGFVIALLAFVLSEAVAPVAQERATNLRTQALTGKAALQMKGGFWAKDGQHFVHVLNPKTANELYGVRIYEFGDHGELVKTFNAKQAIVSEDYWDLRDIEITTLSKQRISSEKIDRLSWPSNLQTRHLEVVVVDPASLALRELYRYVEYLSKNGLDATRYQFEFWSKLLSPLSNMIMLLLAVPFVFGSLRSANAGQRLLLGIVVGVVYYMANLVSGQVAAIYGFYPLLAALIPPLVFTMLGLLLIRRVV